jgi:hypothetical protein
MEHGTEMPRMSEVIVSHDGHRAEDSREQVLDSAARRADKWWDPSWADAGGRSLSRGDEFYEESDEPTSFHGLDGRREPEYAGDRRRADQAGR